MGELPPGPVHVSVYVALLVRAAVDSDPEAGFDPLHAPLAVQEVALVEVQVSIDVPFTATVVGLALNATVGATGGGGFALTVTVAERPVVPPAPVQDRLNVAFALMTGDCSLPEVALLPAHAPEAVQEAAFCELHVSVERAPAATVVGLAVKVTVGAAIRLTVSER